MDVAKGSLHIHPSNVSRATSPSGDWMVSSLDPSTLVLHRGSKLLRTRFPNSLGDDSGWSRASRSKKTGYRRNFEGWDFPLKRTIVLPVAFVLAIGLIFVIILLSKESPLDSQQANS